MNLSFSLNIVYFFLVSVLSQQVEQLANVRKLLKSVISSFVKIKYVLFALFFLILFFAVVATALFRGVVGRPPNVNINDELDVGCNFLSPSSPLPNDGKLFFND